MPWSVSSTSTAPCPSRGWKRSSTTSTTASSNGWPGSEQLRLRLSGDQRLLEGDARIAVQHRVATPDQPVAFLEDVRHSGDLEPAGLALDDPAAEERESLAEEGPDEMRLQTPGLSPLHFLADGRDSAGVETFRGELALGHQGFDRGDIDGAVDLAEELGLDVGPVAVADRVDQKIAQRLALEQLAQHVVDLAAEGCARFFQLVQQASINLAFACVGGAQVPQVADLGLPDPVDRPNRCSIRFGFQGRS